MYKTVLVGEAIADGQKLLHKLKQQHFPFSGAFWYHLPESERWRLFIASPLVESEGPIEAYTRIRQALRALRISTISLNDISVISPHGSEFENLRGAIDRMGSLAVVGQNEKADDLVFEDAYVYTG